jgi:DHA1 family multidrug resistance protein-like MFS transporter
MIELIREAPLGQLIRWVTRNRVLRYPEELPGYELPSTYTAVLNSADRTGDVAASRKISKQPTNSSRRSSSNETSPTPAANDLEKRDTEIQQPRDADPEALSLSRTRSRHEIAPYTEGRLEVEAELALERTQTKPIMPQKTSDGNILVDWYTTDDPANPQNWSNLKRFFISLIICLYTFVVYSGSAIYTSSEQGVMERFNVGPTAASLPLSLYVLAYGLGPLLWSPLSEIPIIGRSPIYAATTALFTILSLPTALVDNFAGLLVLRFLQGFLGSPCLATGAATMQDMYSLLYLPFAL